MTDVAEMLVRGRASTATHASIADQLGRLAWEGQDNGASIHKTLEGWIENGDQERAAVALAYDEALLFESPEQMNAALDRLAARLPALGADIEIRRGWLRDNFSVR